MQLTTYKPELVTKKSFPGLLDCEFKHTVTKAEARFDYTGPPIPVDVWKQVLAFFQWTYDTTHSESQVRLFVNTKTRTWEAWAFPQEARTGMTARELDTPEKNKQRAAFADDAGWVYFGTVHHHCSCSAFQSGTDFANERDQDGLHITIGNMASQRYDLHARFYLGGFGFEPDMSKFWFIGKEAANMVPPELWNTVARYQMTMKVPPNTQFPDVWKENLIEVKSTFPGSQTGTPWTPPYTGGGSYNSSGRDYDIPLWQRARKALAELAEEVIDGKTWTEAKLVDLIEELVTEDTIFGRIAEAMFDHRCSLDAMWQEIPVNRELGTVIKVWGKNYGTTALLEPNNPKKDSDEEREKYLYGSME